ncbi:MAG: translation initiation factor IF-2 N-terminal domain-containing protein, partial [Eubacterium sp.]|nr:translation initiation factor IF-2 N-terminal domain-containing protein [Eubacterium sp.]
MANIRVYELAKELNVDSKEILSFVNEKGADAASAQKALEPDMEAMVRRAFGKEKSPAGTGEKPGTQKDSAEAEGTKGTDDQAAPEAPKKKKRLIAVFRPQNASSREGRNLKQSASRPNQRGQKPRSEERTPAKSTQRPPLVKVPRPHPVMREEEHRVKRTDAAAKRRESEEILAAEQIAEAVSAVTAEQTQQIAEPVQEPAPKVSPVSADEKTVSSVQEKKTEEQAEEKEKAPVKKEKAPVRREKRPEQPDRSSARQEKPGARPERP